MAKKDSERRKETTCVMNKEVTVDINSVIPIIA